jgi:hypothetical protein
VTDPTLPRRSFLSRLSAAAAAFTAGAVAPRLLDAQAPVPMTTPSPADVHALDQWIAAMPGRYKFVLDVVTPEHVSEMAYARNFLSASMNDYQLTEQDHAIIVVLRHTATPWGFNDAMWAKYAVGEKLGVNEPRTEVKATRNPLFKTADGRDSTIAWLAARGVHFALCGLSTSRLANGWARAAGATAADVRAELVANTVPNGHVMAAGVVAVQRAQMLGFAGVHVG